MTARKPPTPDGLNAKGTGRGMKKVVTPKPKKCGASKDRTAPIAKNRATKRSLSCIPVAELQTMELNQPLTEKAKAFIRFWAQGESITSASARAGYGDGATYAYKIRHLPEVQAMYMAEKALYEESCQMTRKRVMDGLLEGVEMAKLMAEPSAVIAGWREIGKMCGYYEPVKVRVEHTHGGARFADMTDAELLKFINEQSASQRAAVPLLERADGSGGR